jgi:hypothetical protein
MTLKPVELQNPPLPHGMQAVAPTKFENVPTAHTKKPLAFTNDPAGDDWHAGKPAELRPAPVTQTRMVTTQRPRESNKPLICVPVKILEVFTGQTYDVNVNLTAPLAPLPHVAPAPPPYK